MEEPFEALISQIKTKDELYLLLDEIEEAKRRVYQYKQTDNLSAKVGETASVKFHDLIIGLEKQGVLSKSAASQNSCLVKLKKHLTNLPEIKLIIAFRPRQEFIDELSSWLKDATGQTILIDLTIQESIIGGLRLEYGGEYRDYSLVKKLEEQFQTGHIKYI